MSTAELAKSRVDTTGAFAIEIDEASWTQQIDRAETWLGNVVTAQTAFRELLENTVPKIKEPNIRLFLSEMLDRARDHESRAYDLFKPIGRERPAGRGVAGTVISTARKIMGTVESLAGGAVGNWHDIRELLVANLDSMGAFAIAEQLGLALGIHELRNLAFKVEYEKSTDQLILQELMLEMASLAVLYKKDV